MEEKKIFSYHGSFELESGETLQSLDIAYHTFGKLNKQKNNIVWVFHALTADSHVLNWWPGLFGENCIFDPQDYFIVCANTIGSPYGSTSPQNLNFPSFTVRDVVNAHFLLAEELDIQEISIAIGGSFGGNQALEFAYSFKGSIGKLILIASSARESAWGIAIHESQRLALQSDETFGTLEGGKSGMKAARTLALLTYRTPDSFVENQTDKDERSDDFKVSSYIQYQGDKFIKRFNALSYFYLSKCLDTHHIGRNRGGVEMALSQILCPSLIISITSDVLIPPSFQQTISTHIPNAEYVKIESKYGHDGFLIETEKLSEVIKPFISQDSKSQPQDKRTVLKFGGKSLVQGKAIENTLEIIGNAAKQGPIAIVVSARGKSTDLLHLIFAKASQGEYPEHELEAFLAEQHTDVIGLDLETEFSKLKTIVQALQILRCADESVQNEIVAFGELISAKTITHLLQHRGLQSIFVDARDILVLKQEEIDYEISKNQTQTFFNSVATDVIPVMTGYIARDSEGKTGLLGRNGSNYSASLLAAFIGAKELQNWTDIDGIYSASPKYVSNAKKIDSLSYREANELANFGANILHSKTILPLIKSDIPIRILNSLNPTASGTLISKNSSGKGMKAVSVVEDVALISIEGGGLLGKVGIDGRIFKVLSKNNISVRVISQASSERGIGFVTDVKDANRAEKLLLNEFSVEIKSQDITAIQVNKNMSIIAILGRHNFALEKAIGGLRRNRIWMHLISNSISGEHISLVIDNRDVKKAVNVVHNHVFGVIKTLHVFAIGKGNVGNKFIEQIHKTSFATAKRRGIKIKIVGIADSKKTIYNEKGIEENWKSLLADSNLESSVQSILQILRVSQLENLVLVDNTSSNKIAEAYPRFIKNGVDIVASNKKANSMDFDFYRLLRKELQVHSRQFFYETNVGAGLPTIDTIRHLYDSADQITRITGVFSGSLSYIFNHYSIEDLPFSTILAQAKAKGYTEPDPREDLSGLDVARKLLILAREVGAEINMDDIVVQNLVPESLQKIDNYNEFLEETKRLDAHYQQQKDSLQEDEVLRYVGEMNLITQEFKTALIRVPKSTPLGSVKNADAIFEIYTDSYGDQPIVIQGAGAGAEVTARGVYSDLVRIGQINR